MALAEIEALRGEREELRQQIDLLPPEYQREIADATRRLLALYATLSGTELQPDPLPENVIPLRR